jgi:tRNA pseudouridine55 synthase
MAELCGVVNVNKPGGVTSRGVVDRIQRLAGRSKSGHAGTLDPLASGVLVVCVGRATRLIEYVQRLPKTYDAAFLLGRSSPTDDIEGPVELWPDLPEPSPDEVRRAIAPLVGEIQQRPPAFSAVKVAGRRAYDRGEAVDLSPRAVRVHRIDVAGYAFPELRLRIECGSGTYVRSLGRDLAESLGTRAVMSSLVRTAIGGFRIEEAVAPDALSPGRWTDFLRPALDAVDSLPRVEVASNQIARLRLGQAIDKPDDLPPGPEWAAVDPSGSLVAILVERPVGLGPRCNIG